ncbi:acetyl-CoA synthetase-like protein [Penicillium chermesinum]|uniref:Acetyl-CoA synthetase-like protein n=1 Tax=Penicillium chermesinum TaxID=63820 RepID=A0A9W9P6C2_9EURO|nr:acetyl-CoA synthetase-like protein [Penicillium chermesinum]KAJ5238771.1 acetyl-CoA synthetase-like protein [Penicillium chermesinum]
MSFNNILELLEDAASDSQSGQIKCYPPGGRDTDKPISFSYQDLLQQAQRASWALRSKVSGSTNQGSPILLHFDAHWDRILWLWAVLFAGYVPVMGISLPNSEPQRIAHLRHLNSTMKSSICLTRAKLQAALGQEIFTNTIAIETLDVAHAQPIKQIATKPGLSDTAIILLTSGSTGNSKLVCLSHGQILAAIAGKMAIAPLYKKCFMNWISLDHVASLIEIHILAIYARGDQVHVQGADILASPTSFLDLICAHRVARTFAPNFFLAKLRTALKSSSDSPTQWDLQLLILYQLRRRSECDADMRRIVGFFNSIWCPRERYRSWLRYDREWQLEYASLGVCMPGIQMRITSSTDSNTRMPTGEVGYLEVSGPAVFKEYLNDPSATAQSFTSDGWFKTGDEGFIDKNGFLNLMGRTKDTIIVNGVKHDPFTIETALDSSQIPGLTPSFNCCFSTLPPGRDTEEICIVYLPTFPSDDSQLSVKTSDAISRLVISALGKLSRARIKKCYENGDYKAYEDLNNETVKSSRNMNGEGPRDDVERNLLAIFQESFGIDDPIHVHTPIFDLGITSIELIKLKKDLEAHLNLDKEIPIATLLLNQSVRALRDALDDMKAQRVYDPVVTLQSTGTKTPLWLVHPGVGEVLVFLNLANLIKDRPVFALRARGFNDNDAPFSNIEETVSTYHAAIKQKQPSGPYAIAGYSYGAMLAFEVSKIFEAQGDTVGFLGSLNLPPHIKTRMRQLDFKECLLHLSYFLDLMSEDYARQLAKELEGQPKEQVLDVVLSKSNPDRVAELALSKDALSKWACLATALQGMAVDYEPSGSVASLDCFYCIPLQAVAASKQQWLDDHLRKWRDFSRSEVRFHDVDGAHYTMLSPEHVASFHKSLCHALEARGL